ncbi:hypothetical protein DVV91_12340 [Clostridium botulinum]|uniref:hypothetical protein n=1 Tax=Clostridium botulinum TaxID=1491 RepID=UPI000174E6DF|nr:hypothetical protein [Clostridium botulinum]ACD54175.1 hypothetical protein CLH_2478 [Clostridium botulinum E3 str. Alaska E43]AJF30324.1 hypothetical protein ST13_11670 [Clostridium botulinum]AJF33387.1 hypothetical protein ST12_11670 [Clostridium botulinum]MBN1049407.1 hypothetical protein [Clostridium botulinum]MBN1075128.1 hypothetical protein [Clostridium botulinum]
MAIGEDLPNNNNLFNVRYCKSRGIIYSSALISEITSKYELDFTDKVSITFTEWKYVSVGKSSAIIVKIV